MNKKVIIIGIGILAVIFIFFVLNRKEAGNTTQNLQNSPKKEISVGNDVCAEFPKEWVVSALGKSIIKISSLDTMGTHSCQYYTDENNFVTLRLNNLSVDNQKKGQTALGRTITTNPKIKMEHFVVVQEDGLINGIYLIINPNLFIVVDRTSTKAASEEEITNFAVKVAERIQNSENVTVLPTSRAEAAVPLPKGEDIVRTFFNLINEGKVSDAVDMLTPNAISDDSAKQAWGAQFNAFEEITLKQIEPAGDNTYKVTLDVKMKPDSQNAKPMPYYGWGDGQFVRWVTLEKVDDNWKVVGIATGP